MNNLISIRRKERNNALVWFEEIAERHAVICNQLDRAAAELEAANEAYYLALAIEKKEPVKIEMVEEACTTKSTY